MLNFFSHFINSNNYFSFVFFSVYNFILHHYQETQTLLFYCNLNFVYICLPVNALIKLEEKQFYDMKIKIIYFLKIIMFNNFIPFNIFFSFCSNNKLMLCKSYGKILKNGKQND